MIPERHNSKATMPRLFEAGMLAGLIVLTTVSAASAKHMSPEDIARSYLSDDDSVIDKVNGFRVVNAMDREKIVTVTNSGAVVKLLTPLNSTFHKNGDEVRAEVISSSTQNEKAWLPVGTVLTGYVDQVDQATFGRTDAQFHIAFYKGSWNGKTFELVTVPDKKDGVITPLPIALTKKAKVQRLLMAATFIAVPLAVGTGGTSLAIRAGAGMVIGGALAEKGHHISGAVNGAWQGAGLGFLDPVVKKGKDVILPEGTQLAIKLREPTVLSQSIVADARRQQSDVAITTLSTSAKIFTPESFETIKKQCDLLVNQGDMALALDYLDKKLKSNTDNEQILSLKETVAEQAIGFRSTAVAGRGIQ